MKLAGKALVFLLLVASAFIGISSTEVNCPLQPEAVDKGHYDNLDHNNETLCTRLCIEGEPPRCCYYKFFLEAYVTLARACANCSTVELDCFRHQCVAADGFRRAILAVNRMMPGPSIQVCQHDTVVIDVANRMKGRSTTIHWHGILQRGTPTMDGVPMVTQCPIMEGQTFRYTFLASHPGTYFWHSHDGPQKVDGLVGSLVVRQPNSKEAHRYLFDEDKPSHMIFVQDWQHETADQVLPEFTQGNVAQVPVSYLVNGRGFSNLTSLTQLYEATSTIPLAQFRVEKGKRYRFRIIGGICLSCPFSISVQSHSLLLTAADKDPIQPITCNTLNVNSGERYEVVIDANQPVAAYWIYIHGLGACSRTSQVAVLYYEESLSSKPTDYTWATNPGYTVNPVNSTCTDASLDAGICTSQLRSVATTPKQVLRSKPDITIAAFFSFHDFNANDLEECSEEFSYNFVPKRTLLSTVNNFTHKQTSSPLLTQFSDIPVSSFCNETCDQKFCECTHLYKVPLNSLVDIYIADMSGGDLFHPFHLHGHTFYVLAQGVFEKPFANTSKEERDKWMNQEWKLHNRLPIKDTVSVTPRGYTVIRVLMDNPGFWLFHCHFNIHNELGMQQVIQVGDLSQMPVTPQHFPKCWDFTPDITRLSETSDHKHSSEWDEGSKEK